LVLTFILQIVVEVRFGPEGPKEVTSTDLLEQAFLIFKHLQGDLFYLNDYSRIVKTIYPWVWPNYMGLTCTMVGDLCPVYPPPLVRCLNLAIKLLGYPASLG